MHTNVGPVIYRVYWRGHRMYEGSYDEACQYVKKLTLDMTRKFALGEEEGPLHLPRIEAVSYYSRPIVKNLPGGIGVPISAEHAPL